MIIVSRFTISYGLIYNWELFYTNISPEILKSAVFFGIMGQKRYEILPRGDFMAKQVHLRLDDSVYEALAAYNEKNKLSVQDSISSAIIQFLSRQSQETIPEDAAFTFIDLFAGIGGMRIAFERAGGHCVYSNEWNKYSQQTYFANFGEQPDGDITKVDASAIS